MNKYGDVRTDVRVIGLEVEDCSPFLQMRMNVQYFWFNVHDTLNCTAILRGTYIQICVLICA